MTSVTFKAFRAIDDPDACHRFIQGHRRVLEIFDIAMITSNKPDWISHPNTYVILVESVDDGRAMGGARVQIADNIMALPIEDAVGKVDKKIYEIVKNHRLGLTGEACGLWNSREIAGYGIGSFFLTRACIALAHQLGLKSLFALAAPSTVKIATNAGFSIERSLGKEGFFNYPKLDLVATAMIVQNVLTLGAASEEDREHIFDLMKNPDQVRKESGPKGELKIIYNLSLKNLKKEV
ncbi:MAG: hypothetical protein JWN76_1377 [Chitinophagaceae bacterium]|nr:hypothetical protein [Chitinophagaceae bacterium]